MEAVGPIDSAAVLSTHLGYKMAYHEVEQNSYPRSRPTVSQAGQNVAGGNWKIDGQMADQMVLGVERGE